MFPMIQPSINSFSINQNLDSHGNIKIFGNFTNLIEDQTNSSILRKDSN